MGRDTQRRSWTLPARHIFVLMGFWGLVNVYTLRVSLSVAIVAMVEPATVTDVDNVTSASPIEACPSRTPEDHANVSYVGEKTGAPTYTWDGEVQGLVLGSFFYGYILTTLPGGVLAEQLGPKWLIGGGILITSVLSLVIPAAAGVHHLAVVAVRILQGLAEVFTLRVVTPNTPLANIPLCTASLSAGG